MDEKNEIKSNSPQELKENNNDNIFLQPNEEGPFQLEEME